MSVCTNKLIFRLCGNGNMLSPFFFDKNVKAFENENLLNDETILFMTVFFSKSNPSKSISLFVMDPWWGTWPWFFISFRKTRSTFWRKLTSEISWFKLLRLFLWGFLKYNALRASPESLFHTAKNNNWMDLIEKKQGFSKKIFTAHEQSCWYLCIENWVLCSEEYVKLL